MLDTVFVGGGIASLYCAFQYKQRYPQARFQVLEMSERVGGRVAWDRFSNVDVVRGAGVGRRYNPDDQLLMGLLVALGIPYTFSQKSVRYHGLGAAPERVVPQALRILEQRRHVIGPGESFGAFGSRVLGSVAYNEFVTHTGFRDFERLNAGVALTHYHFEDTFGKQDNFSFSWKHLIGALEQRLTGHIVLSARVCGIRSTDRRHKVTTADGRVFRARQACVGVTVSTLRELFPGVAAYRHISAQPFARIYARLDRSLPVQGFTIVDSIVQKVLSTLDERVFMVAYCDNKNALLLQDRARDTVQAELGRLFDDEELRVLEEVCYFWAEGTHCHAACVDEVSLDAHILAAQHPVPGVFVVGEVVAYNQGWVGPALRSTTMIALAAPVRHKRV